ncbi:MAG: FKBP-type peptidyl-prolyl cis-trans isomerase [Bacteroidales bacterium]|nr:FKBP-type peptidyl-prolyl cis-trans isomerase [Bacteroidales bacterium]
MSCNPQGSTTKEVNLNTDLDSVCYAIGVDVANNIQRSGFEEINIDAIAKGFDDVFNSDETLIDPSETQKIVQEYFKKLREMKLEKNLKAAQEFLEENKKKEGVITLPSGLQYIVITEGDGPIPKLTDMVKTNYVGTLIDGTEFDSTTGKDPASFRVNGVIKGWTEALQLMKVGSKWKLFIPPDIAYGENPRPGIIEPNMALIFELELLDIEK